MKRFTVECRNVKSFADFVAAMNAGFICPVGGEWNGNLDALDDYLSWPADGPYELELSGCAECAEALGHAAMADWLQRKLATCHPSNRPDATARRAIAQAGRGETLFQVIIEIVAQNPHVRLIQS